MLYVLCEMKAAVPRGLHSCWDSTPLGSWCAQCWLRHARTAGTQAQAAFPPVCESLRPTVPCNKAEGLGRESTEIRNCGSCPLSHGRACFTPEPAGDNVVKASLQAGQLTDLCLFSLRLEGENLQAGKGSEALIPRGPLEEGLDPGPPCAACFLFLNGDTEPQDVQA